MKPNINSATARVLDAGIQTVVAKSRLLRAQWGGWSTLF
jgi:hypothetical protein